MDFFTVTLLTAALAASFYGVFFPRKRRHDRLPPGPRPYPIIGNMLDVPQDQPWVTYRDWSRKYGSDIISLDLPNQPTLIINTQAAATELMEKRSQNYSDRPTVVMDKLMDAEWNFGLMPYGPGWRERRRIFHRFFQPSVVRDYRDVEEREIRAFLIRAVTFTEGIDLHSVSMTFAAIITDIMYGKRIRDTNDNYIVLSKEVVDGLTVARVPGRFLMEYFPILRHIPSWIPGFSARKIANYYKPIIATVRNEPYERVERDIATGIASPSIARTLIQENLERDGDPNSVMLHDELARDMTGIGYTAATDSQASTTSIFFHVMAVSPSLQRKAQDELDAVIGSTRLPTISDIASLPYFQAILMEVLRWSPAAPLGTAHRTINDDEYNGYFIPAGTLVYGNIWAMLRDPDVYPDNPNDFNPERFLRDGKLNPDMRSPDAVWGFGRRICAGRHLAQDTLSLMWASILYVYTIEPLVEGVTETKFTSNFISVPENLPYRFKIRNAAALALAEDESSV